MADTVGVIRCLLCSCGMAANLLIVAIVTHFPAMRTACNVYVANLAAADFSFCLFALVQSLIAIRSTNVQDSYYKLLEDYCNQTWHGLDLIVTHRNVTNHTSPYVVAENCTGQHERVRIFEEYCMEDELNSTSTDTNVTDFYTDLYGIAGNCTWPYPMPPSLQQAEQEYSTLGWTYERSCDVGRVVVVFLAAASIILLTVIAVERYRAITDPLSTRQHGTVKHAGATCAVAWTAAALAAVIDTVARNVVTNDWSFKSASLHSGASCVVLKLESSDTSHPFFVMILLDFLFGYVLPGCVIIPLYVRIVVTVRRSRRLAVRESRTDDQAYLMVLVVTALFLANWLPFHVISFLITRYVRREEYEAIGVALSFAVFNSVANPFLYALLGRNFRDKVKKMFCCVKRCRNGRQWRPHSQASQDTTLTVQVIDTTGQAIGQAQATGGTEQAREQAPATGQVIDQTGQAREQAQATGQVIDTTGQAIEQAKATDGTEQAREHAQSTEQAQATGQTKQAQGTVGTEQAFPNGTMLTIQDIDTTDLDTGQDEVTGRTEQATGQAQSTGGTGQAFPNGKTLTVQKKWGLDPPDFSYPDGSTCTTHTCGVFTWRRPVQSSVTFLEFRIRLVRSRGHPQPIAAQQREAELKSYQRCRMLLYRV
ncbi:hypothetical protein Bbelb_284890 [Branchiostoma belcheri]|nr:hypothetical protein Bbelb_284890 [Branchiostoma belcheri]